MATITEEAIAGEWYVLGEGQRLDYSDDGFLTLRDGVVMKRGAVVGSYVFRDRGALVTFLAVGGSPLSEIAITVPGGAAATSDTDVLSATETTWIDGEDDPMSDPVTLVRRTADDDRSFTKH